MVLSLMAAASCSLGGPDCVAPVSLEAPAAERFQQTAEWSPDGERLAYTQFERTEEGAGWTLFIADADGSNPRAVVAGASFFSFSPDGGRIAFDRTVDGNRDIYSVRVDGSDVRRLTTDGAVDLQPAWSPDGTRIVFASKRAGHADLYLMGADGGDVRRLTSSEVDDLRPRWSPSGRRIVYYTDAGDGKDQVRVISADGADDAPVSDGTGHNIYPDFRWEDVVTFTRIVEGEARTLAFVEVDGGAAWGVEMDRVSMATWSEGEGLCAMIAGGWPKSAVYSWDTSTGEAQKIVN